MSNLDTIFKVTPSRGGLILLCSFHRDGVQSSECRVQSPLERWLSMISMDRPEMGSRPYEFLLHFYIIYYIHTHAKDFPGGSEGRSVCLQCGRPRFDPWVGKIPWRRKWQPTPVLLPGESLGRRGMVVYSPWGRKESDTTSDFTTCTYIYISVYISIQTS